MDPIRGSLNPCQAMDSCRDHGGDWKVEGFLGMEF